MKPEELRIGNYIYNGIGEVFQANGETIAHFYTSESILGKFKPIPLTEQWLKDFGFRYFRDLEAFQLRYKMRCN